MIARLAGGDDAGFTLVELAVVTLVLGVVGAVTATGIIGGMRGTSHAQARVDTLAATQTAIERVSREMRAADPLRAVADDQLVLDAHRGGELHHYRYTVEATSDDEWELVQERWDFTDGQFHDPDWEPVKTDANHTSTTTLVDRLVREDVFVALDVHGEALSEPDPQDRADDAYRLVIQVARAVGDRSSPIEVQTTVTLRNR